jgi:hypothetical protein
MCWEKPVLYKNKLRTSAQLVNTNHGVFLIYLNLSITMYSSPNGTTDISIIYVRYVHYNSLRA